MKFIYIFLLCFIHFIGCNDKEITKTNEVSNTITITAPDTYSTYYDKPFRYYDEVNPYKTFPIHFEAISSLPIIWRSSIDGVIGEGNNININKLSIGKHIISADCLFDNNTSSIVIIIFEAPVDK